MHRHHHHAADAAGLAAPDAADLNPTKDEARGANAGQAKGQQNEPVNSAAGSDAAQAHLTVKHLATLQAALALRGFELNRDASGALWISRWDMARGMLDLAAVEQFARTVGVST